MFVDKFGRTGTKYSADNGAAVHPVGNFLPLSGGILSGNLALGSNNIEFSTGDIHSEEDLSFLINSETKLVLRPNGVDACDAKISNVALPTLAADAASILTGGSLSGNLCVGSNNIEFSTGDISSQEDLSFTINREAKLVIRPNGMDVCDAKISNVALPTLAADAASKRYVDLEMQKFLPLTGGSLSGNLSVGSNNIEFSTGDISSQEDLSFTINREAKLVIRQNGLDACNTKLINIALPTLAADAVSKG